jgi:hypothetical protein
MAKESRLAEIFRQELKKDKGLMAAFLTGAGERMKEKSDIRNYLPKSGITGAITERMFGKPYRAGSSNTNKDSKVERTRDISNSKYIPGMAKDMNLMRLNMQKMVTIWGGKPSKSVSTNMLKGTDTKIAPKEAKEDSGSSGGGLLGGLGSLGGGLMSLGGSLFSGIASVFGGIASGVGGILGGLGKVFSGAGLIGLIAMAGIGWLISELFTNVDFSGLSDTFGNIVKTFKDLFLNEGEQSLSKRWSNFIGSIVAVKDKLVEMVTAISLNIERLGQLFDDLGGGYGIFGMLLGAAAAAGIASSWKGALVGLATNPAGLVAILAGLAIGKIVTDYREGAANNKDEGNTIGSNQRKAIRNVGGISGEDDILNKEKETLQKRLNELEVSAIEAGERNNKPETQKGTPWYSNSTALTKQNLQSDIAKIDTTLGENKTIRDDNERDEGARRRGSYPAPTPTSPQKVPANANTSPTKLGKDAEAMKQLIYDKFIAAGFTPEQAQGAIANAIAESGLNPMARSPVTEKEDSVGLFQLNRKGGVGTGHSVQDLQDPNKNIDLIIAEAKKSKSFMAANTADEATRTFMKTVERPADQSENAQQKRLANLVKSVPDKNLAPNTKEAETKVASYYDQMVALLGALIETTSGTTAAVGAAASATQKSNTKIESPYNDELYPLLLQMHASDLASG